MLYVETRMRYGSDSGLSQDGVVITKFTSQGSKELNGDLKLRPVRATPWQVGETYSEGDYKITVLDSGSDYFNVRLQLPGQSSQQLNPLIIYAGAAIVVLGLAAICISRRGKKKTNATQQKK